MKTLNCKIVLLTVGMLLCTTFAMASADAFDRAKLGASWVTTAGTLSISHRQLVGSSGALAYSTSSAGNTGGTAVVILGGTDVEYGAVALGNIAGGNNAFVKIQSQNGSGTTFDTAAFYTGNNGGGFFFTLSSPVPSPAIVDVYFCGTTATLKISSSAGIQTYTHDYGTTFPSGVGLGTFGSVKLDNFIGIAATPACIAPSVVGTTPATMMPGATDLSLK